VSILKNEKGTNKKQNSVGVQTDKEPEEVWERLRASNNTFYLSKDFITFLYGSAKLWLNQHENNGLKLTLIVLVGCIFAILWYYNGEEIESVFI
jgi:hypothetical protein